MSVGNGVPFLGYSSYVGIAEETAFGTLVTATSFAEFTTESFLKEREELLREEINTTRDFTRRMTGNVTVNGSCEMPMNIADDCIVYLLKQALGGTCGSTTIVAGSISHVLNVGDMENNESTSGGADTKSLSIQVRRGSEHQWSYRGVRVNSVTIKGEVGAPVTAAFELMGQHGTNSSDSLTASFSNINPLNFTGVTFQTGITISAVTTEYISAFELVISNNLAEQRNLGSDAIYALPPLRRDVKLKLTQQFDTLTAYNRFIQNTKTAIQILMDTGISLGAAGGSSYSMHINLPACYYNNIAPAVGSVEAISQELNVSAIKDTTTSYVVQMQIHNATLTY